MINNFPIIGVLSSIDGGTRARDEIDISQEELAHRSNLNRSYMSDLERNKKQPSLYTFFALAKELGIDPEELLKEVKQSIDFDVIFGEDHKSLLW